MIKTRMSKAKAFPTRLTDAEWAILEPLVPANKRGGRPPKYCRRALVEAMIYAVRQGCTWRALPSEFPHWNTVFWYYQEWQKDGTWDRIQNFLRRMTRKAQGREEEPSAGILDSQTVRGTEQPGPRGYDGGKKNYGSQKARVRGHDGADLGTGRNAGECT
jgi:transposase